MTEIIKFDRIVSVNSEIQGHAAQNILEGEIRPNRNWMCEPGTEKAVVIVQLERAAVVTSVHVGNAHSAFVEVLVGRAADSSGDFQSFVPMSSFMNPQESKTGTNPNRTRFFTKKDFNEAEANKSWDRVKIVCSQPFNKYVSYGLCFVKVQGEKEARKAEAGQKSADQEDIQIGSFFKKMRASVGNKPLTVNEPAKEAEKDLSLQKHSTSSTGKGSEKKSSKKKQTTSGENEGGNRKKSKEDTSAEEREEKSRRKRKEKEVEEKTEKRRREEMKIVRRRPFQKLMEDVVLVISGFQNPLRGDIRSKALEMGANYSADWNSNCTHLVSAYENTPKCHKVRGKGKIVKREWVEKCHEDRKRYPWRRFALGKEDAKKPESEEEVEEGEEEEEEVGNSLPEASPKIQDQKNESSIREKPGSDDYETTTDDDEEKKKVDTSDYPMPFLPDIFSRKTFFLDPNLKDRAILERYIVAYNGVLTETFEEEVDFYVTDKRRVPIEVSQKKLLNLVAVKPSWIWEINLKQEYTPTTAHLVE